jgi:hypothetical protein
VAIRIQAAELTELILIGMPSQSGSVGV